MIILESAVTPKIQRRKRAKTRGKRNIPEISAVHPATTICNPVIIMTGINPAIYIKILHS